MLTDVETLTTIFVFSLIAILLIKDRKKIERQGILFIRRSSFAKDFMESFGKKHSGIINKLAIIAVVVSFILMFVGIKYLVTMTMKNILRPEGYKPTPSVGLVLPTFSPICKPPYVICVPPLYWLIVILVVVSFHESMHGFIAASNKIKIKSVGYAFLAVLPAAFVEPDEKKLKKVSELTKLKVYAGGSFGNIISALLFFLLLIAIGKAFTIFFEPAGVAFDVINGTPAYYANLTGYLISINNVSTKTIDDFIAFMNTTKPNQTISILTSDGMFNLTLAEHPDKQGKGFIGITDFREVYSLKNDYQHLKKYEKHMIGAFSWLYGLLNWIFFINIAVAIFNMLPVKPLDGGLMIESLLKILKIKNAEKISNWISYLVLITLLVSVFSPIF